MFMRFANFYQSFIQSLSRIVALFTFILKTIELACKLFKTKDEVVKRDSRVDEAFQNLSKSKKQV